MSASTPVPTPTQVPNPATTPPVSQEIPSRDSQWSTLAARSSGSFHEERTAGDDLPPALNNSPLLGPSPGSGIASLSETEAVMALLQELRVERAQRKAEDERKEQRMKEMEEELERLKGEKNVSGGGPSST